MRTYTNITPTINGEELSLDVLSEKPRLVQRRLVDRTSFRWIMDVILTGRESAPQGSVLVPDFSLGEMFAEDDPTIAASGAEAEGLVIGDTEFRVVKAGDNFVFVEVAEKAARRLPGTTANRALEILVNTILRSHEDAGWDAIKAASGSGNFTGHTTSATAAWSLTTNISYDVFRAIEAMESREGYGLTATALVLDTSVAPHVLANEKLVNAYAREDKTNPIYTGNYPVVAGLPVLVSNRLHARTGQKAAVVDTNSLGGLATEVPLTGEVIHNRERRVFRCQAEKADVPFVFEPLAFQALATGT